MYFVFNSTGKEGGKGVRVEREGEREKVTIKIMWMSARVVLKTILGLA